ncbi:two-component sensor histidine kinase [Planotetraspora thailandica]|uniref:histidine kinase n=1 Tax=Planotetraspora thailandica TaxID=487172 RepID=A0A8J4DGD0_9ACTN|nr:histidine kinase [Planotetraspora thailandica]GII59865.1 two-component sensor histidine kinase [Planotetraspora thailandica]
MLDGAAPAEPGRRRAWLFDVSIAAAFVAVGQIDVWAPWIAVWWADDPVAGPAALNSVLFFVIAASLAWRRRAPLVVSCVVAGAAAAQAVITATAPIGLLLDGPVLVSLYSVAAYSRRGQALTGLAVTAVALAVHDLQDPAIRSGEGFDDALFWWLVHLVGWVVGRYVGSRRAAAAMAQRAKTLEGAVRTQRDRIARELHDVVAHGVSVVTVQAGAALSVLDERPDRAREALMAIESTARGALDEMRRLLGVLRAEDIGPSFTPQPSLTDLAELCEQVGAAGLPVALSVEGAVRRLPAGVELAGYRIVQEALTNALRHSGASGAEVRVSYGTDDVVLCVVDDGTGAGEQRGGGFGLIGMRERAAIYGGELTTGPRDSVGYAVRARLPYPQVQP